MLRIRLSADFCNWMKRPPLPRNAILKQDMVKVSKKDKKCVVLLQFVKREGRVPKHKERENEISIGTFWKHIRSQGINHPIYKQRLQSNAILKQDMEEKTGKVSKKVKCAVLLQFQSSYLRTSSTYKRMRSSSKIWRRRRWKFRRKTSLWGYSVHSTYSSNHTVEKISTRSRVHPVYDIPVILSLLQMNRNVDKSQVAREKILKCYFSGGADAGVHVFAQIRLCCHCTWVDAHVWKFSRNPNTVWWTFAAISCRKESLVQGNTTWYCDNR